MAVVIDGGGGDRKKPLHAELNLVPYIDLLTCMVAFLLITAVWTQLARLEVQQKGQGEPTRKRSSTRCGSPSPFTTTGST